MNLTGRKIYKKPEKPTPEQKRADREYMLKVKRLPCFTCGKHGPSEVHHCRDTPDDDELHIYFRVPGMAMKSTHRDALPLCEDCHLLFHLGRPEFHRKYGRDYRMLPQVRELVEAMGDDDCLGDWF